MSTPFTLALPQADLLMVVLLLSLRISTVVLLTPLWGLRTLPSPVRIVMVGAFSIALATGARPDAIAPIDTRFGNLLVAALCELALGATLALGLLVVMAAFALAGRLLDVQIGFGIAQVFDPQTNRQMPLLSGLFHQLAIAAFFAFDGAHLLLRGLAASVGVFPPGQPWALAGAAPMVFKLAGGLFSWGFALVAPVVFCLLLAELALGLLARNLPQMNLLVLGLPIKIIVGLLGLVALWSTGGAQTLTTLYRSVFAGWEAWFTHG